MQSTGRQGICTRCCAQDHRRYVRLSSFTDPSVLLVLSSYLIVDGLGRLPPIRLKSDDEETSHLEEKTPRASSFAKRQVEDDEDGDKPSTDTPHPSGSNPPQKVLHESDEMVTSPSEEFSSSETVKALAPDTATPLGDSPAAFTTTTGRSGSHLTVEVPDRTPSPRLTISPVPPHTPTPVSGDIILPLMIFAVVKANPPRLVSHLLYTQRFRNQAVGGEESYCLINLLAVAEFLENVDLAALGLGEKEKSVIRCVSVFLSLILIPRFDNVWGTQVHVQTHALYAFPPRSLLLLLLLLLLQVCNYDPEC